MGLVGRPALLSTCIIYSVLVGVVFCKNIGRVIVDLPEPAICRCQVMSVAAEQIQCVWPLHVYAGLENRNGLCG